MTFTYDAYDVVVQGQSYRLASQQTPHPHQKTKKELC